MILCCVCGEKLTNKSARYVMSKDGKRVVCELHEKMTKERFREGVRKDKAC